MSNLQNKERVKKTDKKGAKRTPCARRKRTKVVALKATHQLPTRSVGSNSGPLPAGWSHQQRQLWIGWFGGVGFSLREKYLLFCIVCFVIFGILSWSCSSVFFASLLFHGSSFVFEGVFDGSLLVPLLVSTQTIEGRYMQQHHANDLISIYYMYIYICFMTSISNVCGMSQTGFFATRDQPIGSRHMGHAMLLATASSAGTR